MSVCVCAYVGRAAKSSSLCRHSVPGFKSRDVREGGEILDSELMLTASGKLDITHGHIFTYQAAAVQSKR